MRRSLSGTLTVVLAALALVALGLPGGAAPGNPAAPPQGVVATSALVELVGDPLTISPRTRPERGRKVDFDAATVKAERARLAGIRNDFKRWLQRHAPKAVVTNEFDVSLHAVGVTLDGTTLERLRSAPMVQAAELTALFQPAADDDPDLRLVRAAEAWTAAGGAEEAGEGVRIAVIDSGIDATHPCFDDTGYPAQPQLGNPALTNNKVIVAKVFSNKAKKARLDASDANSHGTHVAGIAACNAHTRAVVDGLEIPYAASGVAPRALLGNYNVFPGDDAYARSEDILEALEAAYEDGFEVANMSLGDKRNFGSVMLAKAVDNADRGNMVVAVSAGNDGPGSFTVGYPGAATRALTAGATTVGHAIVQILSVSGADFEMVRGEFGALDRDLTATLHVVADPTSGFPHGLHLACDDGPPLPPLAGEVAMIGRGGCDFTVKVRNAQHAGAVAVVVVQREEGAAFVMGHNGLEPAPTIPAVMVTLGDGAAIDDHHGEAVTLRSDASYLSRPAETNRIAEFSSRGPTQQDLLVKPDLVAPGADVLSAFPAAFCKAPPCWAIQGGTSMAAPHLAGAAAVVRGVHPDWSSADVRSAIVNTAQEGVVRDGNGSVVDDVNVVGAGLLDVVAAVGAVAAMEPVSTAFGAVASGSGASRTRSLAVTNLSGVTRSFRATAVDEADDGVTFSVTTGAFTLAPGSAGTVDVSVTATKGAADGPRHARLRLDADGIEAGHAVLFVFVGEGDRAPGPHLGNRNTN